VTGAVAEPLLPTVGETLDACPFRTLLYRQWHWPPRELEMLALLDPDCLPLPDGQVGELVHLVNRGGTLLLVAGDGATRDRAKAIFRGLFSREVGRA